MKFETTLQLNGKTATGIEVPPEVVDALGSGKRPPVSVSINGHTYRSTIASRGERFLVGVSADNRELAGVAAGDEIEVEIALDIAPREVTVPADLATALAPHPDARRFFDGLTHSQQQAFVVPIEQAKKPETRQRRVAKAVGALRDGRKAA
jgi:Bacteriocin-protection, YdeI or OmpD-Associated/Domain of unknown function (DUF1905)